MRRPTPIFQVPPVYVDYGNVARADGAYVRRLDG